MTEFTIGAVFREWSELLKALLSPLLRLGLILIGGPVILGLALAPTALASAASPPNATLPASPNLLLLSLPGLLLSLGWTYFHVAAMWMAGEVSQGRRPTIGGALSAAGPRFFPVLAVMVVTSIVIGLASVLLVVPGMILLCVWAVAIPVTVFERPGFVAALKRSAALTRGYRLRIFGVYLIEIGAVFALSLCLGLLGTLLHKGSVAGTAPDIIVNIFSASVYALTAAAIYITLRRVKEGSFAGDVAAVFD